ncbi:hypothetical protein HEQ60_03380 [Haematospirillum sp. H1815]|uniref:hypothetical protein n=1 Tax=Haematospirillum sp. H1815 TaxID=2723108 RepID=UPI0014389BFF|nr:hypothetical protein [Haematospirillum sp. H1815]NKD76810.1 hypothetical protein [Haematospirillum sp. H1815]
MALDRIDICNRALLMIGALPVSSLEDPTPVAEVARHFYDMVRDAFLSVHPWNFALTTEVVPVMPSVSCSGYAFTAPLPVACLRVLSVGRIGQDRGVAYRIVGRQVECDASPVVLHYIAAVPESVFPAFFVNALVLRLAAAFCLPLTESAGRADHLWQAAEQEFRRARAVDSSEDTPKRVGSSILLDVRR